jgi:hypothetical protein
VLAKSSSNLLECIRVLTELRVAAVRSEKLVAESLETQRKGIVRSWKPLPSNG